MLEFFLKEVQNIHIACSVYYGCWWPGNSRDQAINNNGSELVSLEYSQFQHQKV